MVNPGDMEGFLGFPGRPGGMEGWRGVAVLALLASMALFFFLMCGSDRVMAQGVGEPSPEQKRAAAEAYDRGTTAWLAEQYGRAARFFETAYRLVPAAPALLQAVRANERAGNTLRAATLALLLKERYPGHARAAAVADRVLLEHGRSFTKVEVSCDECTLELDGAIVEQRTFFVEPEQEHTVVAGFPTGTVRKTVRGHAGETVSLSFDAPEPPPPAASEEEPGSAPRGPQRGGEPLSGSGSERHGTPLVAAWVPVTLGVATLAAAGVTVWSGIDTLAARDEYVARPTREGYERGVGLERRTNVLIGVSAALGVATAVTSWLAVTRGEPERRQEAGLRPGVRYVRGGAQATLRVWWP